MSSDSVENTSCRSPRIGGTGGCGPVSAESASSSSLFARLREADRIFVAILAVFVVLLLIAPGQASESLRFALQGLWGISGFLLVSVLFAAYARASAADQLTAKVFAAGGVGVTVVAAATFGVLASFCSCGVILVVAALLAAGAPLSAVMAFWASSPLMDPEMFLLTAGSLGTEFAIARLGAAFGVVLLAGYTTWALQRRGLFESALKKVYAGRVKSVDNPGELRWSFWRKPVRRALFAKQFERTELFLLNWLALAFALESLMIAYLPAEAVGSLLGANTPYSVPLAVLTGVPAYLNGYAAIPTVGGLMELGMSGGAALAVYALVRGRVFVWYLTLALAGSMLAGFAYAALSQLP